MEEKRGKKKYERPVVTREKKMDFPIRILEASNGKIICKQCSSCHGCR